MGLKEDIKDWTDPDGLVCTTYKPITVSTTGNGIMYTSLAYMLMVMTGVARGIDYKIFSEVINKCRVGSYIGLFNRSPQKKDEIESFDDYIALAAASAPWFMHAEFSQDIIQWGRQFHWCFNNVKPKKFSFRSWLGRDPSFVAHCYYAVGRKPNPLYRLIWAISVATAGIFDKNDCTSRILTWMKIETMNECSLLGCIGASIWRLRLKGDYPGGMKEVMTKYFGENHPIAKYFISYPQ